MTPAERRVEECDDQLTLRCPHDPPGLCGGRCAICIRADRAVISAAFARERRLALQGAARRLVTYGLTVAARILRTFAREQR